MFRAFVHEFALGLLIIELVVLLCILFWFRKSRWPRRPKWMIALIVNAVFGYPALWGIWIEFGCAREKAHGIICLSHIKRTGMAISMYTQSWDDTLLPASR
ncbi:MAG: hypothetical protein IT210_23105 [Armatimonadetes bacterium]|nr:hypothetical protein [Armatimonadota bacterium]